MKHEKLIYSIACIIVIISAAMKILHLPYSNSSDALLIFAFVGVSFFQGWYVTQLKKRIKELENK